MTPRASPLHRGIFVGLACFVSFPPALGGALAGLLAAKPVFRPGAAFR